MVAELRAMGSRGQKTIPPHARLVATATALKCKRRLGKGSAHRKLYLLSSCVVWTSDAGKITGSIPVNSNIKVCIFSESGNKAPSSTLVSLSGDGRRRPAVFDFPDGEEREMFVRLLRHTATR